MDDCLQILKVKVYHSISSQEFGYADDGADKEFISHSECTRKWQVFDTFNLEQALIWNNQDRIAILPQSFKTPFSILSSSCTFRLERIGDDSDGHCSLFLCKSCDMTCSSSSRSTSHTCCNDCKLGVGRDCTKSHFGLECSGFSFCRIATSSSSSCSAAN